MPAPPVNFIIDMILGEEVHLQQPEIAIKIVGKEERERLYCYYTEEDEDTANCNGYSADKCWDDSSNIGIVI